MALRRLFTFSTALVLLLTGLNPEITSARAAKNEYLAYVGAYTDQESTGIYSFRFDSSTGKLTSLGLASESTNPSFLTSDARGHVLYAVNELDTYQGKPTGAVSAFAIDTATGKLSLINQVSSGDQGPAHVTLDRTGKFAFVSNYSLGSVAVFSVLKDGRVGDQVAFVQHQGSSVNKQWQLGPHVHEVVLSQDNRFALVADPGIDQVIAYPFNGATGKLGEPVIAHAPPGSGPRHMVFGRDGKFLYVITELTSSVLTYAYDAKNGGLRQIGMISTLSKEFSGTNYGAEIEVHPSGKFLYASNRGDDSIAVFSVDSETGALKLIEVVLTKGKASSQLCSRSDGIMVVGCKPGI